VLPVDPEVEPDPVELVELWSDDEPVADVPVPVEEPVLGDEDPLVPD